jgi:hypothetical protein
MLGKIDAASVKRIMVPWKQENGNRNPRHSCASLRDCSAVYLVRLEDVAGHDDEFASFLCRDPAEITDSLETCRTPPALGLCVEEISSYSKLPVACVQKACAH